MMTIPFVIIWGCMVLQLKKYPFMHTNVTEKKTYLACHSAESSFASPKTSHPHFKNCLKCHNDDISPELLNRSKKPPWEW
jgi:hypothetical protein